MLLKKICVHETISQNAILVPFLNAAYRLNSRNMWKMRRYQYAK